MPEGRLARDWRGATLGRAGPGTCAISNYGLNSTIRREFRVDFGHAMRNLGGFLMSFKTILVNVDVDGPVEPSILAACDLARRFRAKVIGLCAADAPMPVTYPETDPAVVGVWDQMRDQLKARFRELHAVFDRLTADRVESGWREALGPPTNVLIDTARVADLIVMAAPNGAASGSTYRAANPGSVLLQAGRPVLVLAYGTDHVPIGRAIVAWKDTREARRAAREALPFLAMAKHIAIVEIADEADLQTARGRVQDVAEWLLRHGIRAVPLAMQSYGDDASHLDSVLREQEADLVVAGAYGHNRLREWAFGGVTHSLLQGKHSALLSH